MTIIRSALRTRALQFADAVGSARWDVTAATGEVDLHMGVVHAREWKKILNVSPFYRAAKRTPTSDATGQYAISGLTIAGENFYRVLFFAVSGIALREVHPKEGIMALTNGYATGIWYRQGDYLVAPAYPSTAATGIYVNHTPTRADNLASDATVVVFPEDYEDILAYELAAIILSKGGAEVEAGGACKALAQGMRMEMLTDVQRISNKHITLGPERPTPPDLQTVPAP